MKFAVPIAAAVLIAVLGTAAPAGAKMSKLKGQVIGQPYTAKKGTVVPVLLAARSGKRARLMSCVGTLRVSEAQVSGPRRTQIATRLLRLGDVVQARAKVRRKQRRAGYWQLTARKLTVKSRSGTLSPAELEELVAAVRAELTRLNQTVVNLATATAEEFKSVRAELASLRADMSALRSDFATLAAQVATAGAQLTALEASLQAQIDALGDDMADVKAQLQQALADIAALNAAVASLGTQLTTLQGQVTTLTSDLATVSTTVGTLSGQLGDVEALLTGVAPGDIGAALADIGTLQTSLAALEGVIGDSSSGLVQQVNALSSVVGGAGTGLVGAVSALQAADVTTASDIAALEASVADAEGRLDDLETLVSGPGGLTADVAALQTTVGNASSGLVQQVNTLQTNMNIVCGPTSPLNALC